MNFMVTKQNGIYITWGIFQRRTESLASNLNLHKLYYYYTWEDRSKLHKLCSYFLKSINLVADLIGIKPNITFIQLPPTPVLYIVALYCKVSGNKYVADCHNAMLYSSKWFKWPLTKRLLRKADAILVHNEDVRDFAKSLGLTATILRERGNRYRTTCLRHAREKAFTGIFRDGHPLTLMVS